MNLKLALSVCTIALFSFNNSFAQRDKKDCIGIYKSSMYNSKGGNDTLMPPSFYTGNDTLYKYVQGGYSFGTNVLADRAYAQAYKVNAAYYLKGIAFWCGAKKQTGTSDTLNVIIYSLNGTGTATSGTVSNAPKTIEKIIKIPVDSIDTTHLTVITFPDTFIAYTDYAVGVEFSNMGDDSLGLVTTKDGDADSTELSWNKYSDGTWYTILEPTNWGMDLDLGIFMIVDTSTANINDSYFIDGIKLSQNQPNPATNATLIQYEIQNNASVSLEIYDITGRLVLSYDEGNQIAGKHNILVDSDKLMKGTYFYSLKADNHRLTKKMIITQ